jgi:hypothetical protein
MAHGLADYLDGYDEFLDEHDRRALGLAPMQIAPQRQQANVTRAPVQMFVAPQQYAAPPNPTRLRAALLPAGRAMAVPFAQSGATLLNPGSPVTGSPASMPMAPTMYSTPSSGDVPTIQPDPTGSTPSSAQQPQYLSTRTLTMQPQQPSGSSGSASGTSGIDASTFGWLALALGAYWMWKNVRD